MAKVNQLRSYRHHRARILLSIRKPESYESSVTPYAEYGAKTSWVTTARPLTGMCLEPQMNKVGHENLGVGLVACKEVVVKLSLETRRIHPIDTFEESELGML